MVITIVIAIAAILVVYLAISAYIAHSLMKVPRLPLGDNPASVGLSYEGVAFPSRIDKLTLRGWYIAGEREFNIIIVTGMRQNRVDYSIGILEMTRDLVAKGYSVLLFDQRGRGESEGNGVLLTKVERDIGGAVDYIKGRGCPAQQICFIGFSAGAASAIVFASGEDVAALVSDSCFANVADTFIGKGTSESGLPRLIIKIFGLGTLFMSRIMYGYRKVNPIDRIADVACPILFIQGEKDDLVPVEDAYKLLAASGKPSDEIWIVPDAKHTETYCIDPVGYIDRVASFLAKIEQGKKRPASTSSR
jgi:alpha-beta hydrolase superfamily lysophospholipase